MYKEKLVRHYAVQKLQLIPLAGIQRFDAIQNSLVWSASLFLLSLITVIMLGICLRIQESVNDAHMDEEIKIESVSHFCGIIANYLLQIYEEQKLKEKEVIKTKRLRELNLLKTRRILRERMNAKRRRAEDEDVILVANQVEISSGFSNDDLTDSQDLASLDNEPTDAAFENSFRYDYNEDQDSNTISEEEIIDRRDPDSIVNNQRKNEYLKEEEEL